MTAERRLFSPAPASRASGLKASTPLRAGDCGEGVDARIVAPCHHLSFSDASTRRKEYYSALEQASRSLEITPWLFWFASTAIEAERRSLAHVEFLIHKTRLMDSLQGTLKPRQEKALLRMFEVGHRRIQGRHKRWEIRGITGAPPATVTRDLVDLVAKGALVREGEKKLPGTT